jgi:Flp pilus assembly protein TadG
MKLRKDRGATIIEFALVLPIFLLLIFGMIELSVALYDKAMITNASREGARAGIVYKDPRVTDGEIGNVVNTYLATRLITFGGSNTATTTVTRNGSTFGSELRVQVNYNYSFLVLPGFITGSPDGINMVATTTMRLE